MTPNSPRSPSFPGSRSVRRGAALVWLAAACSFPAIVLAQSAAAPEPAASRAELARLQQRAQVLERQLELSRGKDFYLILDPAGPDLALMLRGAELQRYAILGLQIGRPRVSWVTRGSGFEWQGTIWSGGELDPPRQLDRLVVEGDQPGQSETEEPKPPAIPRTAEELYPVPSRYHVRFAGGLSIEIRPREADASVGRFARLSAWWAARWRDARTALVRADEDAVRLRVVLRPEDAASLYRALPPAARLLVLPGGPAAPAATTQPGR